MIQNETNALSWLFPHIPVLGKIKNCTIWNTSFSCFNPEADRNTCFWNDSNCRMQTLLQVEEADRNRPFFCYNSEEVRNRSCPTMASILEPDFFTGAKENCITLFFQTVFLFLFVLNNISSRSRSHEPEPVKIGPAPPKWAPLHWRWQIQTGTGLQILIDSRKGWGCRAPRCPAHPVMQIRIRSGLSRLLTGGKWLAGTDTNTNRWLFSGQVTLRGGRP